MTKNITIPVTRSTLPTVDDFNAEIKDIWSTHWLTNMGDKHKKLQQQLKKYLNVDNIELFTNGHMALELAIQALDLTGEIITTPYTFASTTHAIVRNNCKPVFCDIDPNTFTIDANKIETLITSKTSAILPVHVYGNICDVEAIDNIAKKYNLKVIYDAAHAFGEKYNNIDIGNYGDVSMFSFHATKVFNTIEGGAATFHDERIGKRLYQLKNFGIKNEEEVDGIGANAKMNEFCAAMGLCNLKYVDKNINNRKIIVSEYTKRLNNIKWIKINSFIKNIKYNYSYFPIIIDAKTSPISRDDLHTFLKDRGIITRKYFYPITNAFECYSDMHNPHKTPIALEISQNVLTLPLYPDLSIKEVNKICNLILELNERSI